MENKNYLFIRLEAIWWLITAIVAMVILVPLCTELPGYPFFWDNLLFIVVFITFTRLIFLLPYTLIADKKYIKVVLVFLCVLIGFVLVQKVVLFKIYMDENGTDSIVGNLTGISKSTMMSYIRSEFMLFGVGAVVSSIILPFRLMRSIWKQINED